MTEAEFIDKDGRLVWKETEYHELEDTGCVYLCKEPGDSHYYYKLQMIPYNYTRKEKDQGYRFFWAALWNTCGTTGGDKEVHKYNSTYETIEKAIRDMLDKGNKVVRTNFGKFTNL